MLFYFFWDFDGYDYLAKNMTLKNVINDEKRKMGHAFVLSMLLQDCKLWENEDILVDERFINDKKKIIISPSYKNDSNWVSFIIKDDFTISDDDINKFVSNIIGNNWMWSNERKTVFFNRIRKFECS